MGAHPKPVNYTPLEKISKIGVCQWRPKRHIALVRGMSWKLNFFAPELNDRMTVRPDGKISIMLAQDIQASGLTAEELAGDIRVVLAPHVKQLDLVVIVRGFASQRALSGARCLSPVR